MNALQVAHVVCWHLGCWFHKPQSCQPGSWGHPLLHQGLPCHEMPLWSSRWHIQTLSWKALLRPGRKMFCCGTGRWVHLKLNEYVLLLDALLGWTSLLQQHHASGILTVKQKTPHVPHSGIWPQYAASLAGSPTKVGVFDFSAVLAAVVLTVINVEDYILLGKALP